ncbi:hypothetical protein ACLB2K_015058 [Fragaria x ananassa]
MKVSHMNFKNSLSNTSALADWNVTSRIPCNNSQHLWAGVLSNNGSVYGLQLQLQSMGLAGQIDINTLSELPALKTISFINNSFEGPLPDVKRLSLIGVYLSQNRFSGDIPDDAFSGMGGTYLEEGLLGQYWIYREDTKFFGCFA